MAQAVLAREDPQETLLKNLPSKPAHLEVIYPVREHHAGSGVSRGLGHGALLVAAVRFHCYASGRVHSNSALQTAYKERMVRRQLRHVAASGRRRHATRLVWWTLAMLPQVGSLIMCNATCLRK
jgi:hypothetical protein